MDYEDHGLDRIGMGLITECREKLYLHTPGMKLTINSEKYGILQTVVFEPSPFFNIAKSMKINDVCRFKGVGKPPRSCDGYISNLIDLYFLEFNKIY